MIASVQVPHFATAIHRLEAPELNGRPLTIANGHEVLAVCEGAASEGIKPGMTLSQAAAICAEIQVVPAISSHYQAGLNQLAEVFADFSPIVETVSDWGGTVSGTVCCYLDLGQLQSTEARHLGQQIALAVAGRLRLKTTVGLARGKFPAYVAASYANGKPVLVQPRREPEFLSDLPITLLPLDRELARQFHLLGLRTLGDLAILPGAAVLARFGKQGQFLQRLAQGRDDRPLVPYRARKQEQVKHCWDEPVGDWGIARAVLNVLAEKLTARLQMADLVSREISLWVRLEDGTVQEETLHLREPAISTRYLAGQLVRLLKRVRLHCGLVEIAVTLNGLTPALGRQLDLFPTQRGRREAFDNLLKDLMGRYGADCFYRVEVANPRTLLLEQRFRVRRADAP